MTSSDQYMVALCLWREARGEGEEGMHAVASVILNRAEKRNTSPYTEVIRPWAFSSITAKGDPQLSKWPQENDPAWITAKDIALATLVMPTTDPTKGATLYYDDSISFPKSWRRAAVEPTVKIGRLNFFKEA
jgi:spore germination cell wall hydrolase CwlJ-like protein